MMAGLILLFCIMGLSACSSKDALHLKDISKPFIVYGNYEYGHYYLSMANSHTLKVRQKLKITDGWTDNINLDKNNKIWIPIINRDGTRPADNRVIVVDLKNKTKKIVKVGDAPHYLYFKGENTYVVCDEDGENPSLYKIDKKLHAKKIKTIHKGGLINSATFDGETIYLLTNHIDTEKSEVYPMLERLSLDGHITIKVITKEDIGNNGIGVINNQLIIGLQSGKNAILNVYDKKSLKKIKELPYNQSMVGQILPINNKTIAVTNYSATTMQGNKITFIDINSNQIEKVLTSTHPVEFMNSFQNKYILVDNDSSTAEILRTDGKREKVINIPTQVFNMFNIAN